MPFDAIFSRPASQPVYIQQPTITIPSPPKLEDPKVEAARLAAISARARAQGRDSTIFTDAALENKAAPIRKPNLGG